MARPRRVLPKDKFAEAALGYLRNQWDALQVYLDDGRLPIDNNEVEQLMKQVCGWDARTGLFIEQDRRRRTRSGSP